jgi:NitT/TauT family transport system substrate-binding protein
MRQTVGCTLAVLLIPWFFSACSRPPHPTPTPVIVQLSWTHQAQFAGLYAADHNGYYAAEGLTVTLVEGGPWVDELTAVLNGAAQFGIAGADGLILARANGKPLRAIATIYRRSPIVFFAFADSGITRPEDFIGKAIRVTRDTTATFRAMMARVGIAPEQYTEAALETFKPADLALPSRGNVQVWATYIHGPLMLAAQQAGPLHIIHPDDYGVHFYADCLLTTDHLIANHPELVRRFLRATLKGWTYAVEQPTASGALVARYKPDTNAALEITKLTTNLPLINTGEDHIGWMRPDVWSGIAQTLRQQGVLTAPVDVTEVYTLQFLREMYGDNQ